MNFQIINKDNIIKFYENKIDDIADEDIRDKLYNKLSEIEDLLIVLEEDIDDEIRYQRAKFYDLSALNDEFNYQNRMPMGG